MLGNCLHTYKEAISAWAIFFVLLVISLATEQIKPPVHYVIKQELYKYSYPLKENTVPSWTVPLFAGFGSLLVLFFVLAWDGFWQLRELEQKDPSAPKPSIWQLKRGDVVRALHGLIFSMAMTVAITNTIKNLVGRKRPDFVARCWPDGVVVFEKNVQYSPEFNMDGGYPKCTGKDTVVREGMKSFPSGHSSVSMAGLGMIGWELFKFMGARHTLWRPALGFLPFVLAILVAVSRVNDYWHHWQDVTVGLLLGFLVSWIAFNMFFPSADRFPFGSQGIAAPSIRLQSRRLRTSGPDSDAYPEPHPVASPSTQGVTVVEAVSLRPGASSGRAQQDVV